MFRSRIKNIVTDNSFESLQNKEAKNEFDTLLSAAKNNLPKVNEKLLEKAFLVCLDANKDRLRLSGQPYYKHYLSVAMIVTEDIKIDDISIAAALLLDVIRNDNEYDAKLIRKEFGTTIAEILSHLDKISNIEEEHIKSETELENYRKLLMSLFKDVRIIFIKLAERLENLKTIEPLPEEKQKKDAKEALEVFAPFADRFGIRNIKWLLEDLAFKTLDRKNYDIIKQKLLGTRKEREMYVDNFKNPIMQKIEDDPFLKKNNVEVDISGRAKHIYSIFNKMHARGKPVEELYDLIAIRLIVKSDDPFMCFYIYGIIASIYPPVPETFKDYINAPKQNGYQSIHSAVLGPRNKPVEVQIRTKKMHEVAERGVAAHFNYKRKLLPAETVLDNQNALEWMDSVREMLQQDDVESPEEQFNFLKKNMFLEEIHVFSPTNELYTLPANSTPLDYAYKIHTEVGNRYIGAKANGRIVSIDYKMQSGDQINILTSNEPTVKEEWLSIVRTSKAKSTINKYLKSQRSKLYNRGRKVWKKEIVNSDLGLKQIHIDKLVERLGLEDEYWLYTQIGADKIDIKYISALMKEIVESGDTKLDKIKPLDLERHNIIASLIVKGEDRPGIVSDITKKIIQSKSVYLNGVSFDTLNDEFEGKLTLKLSSEKELSNVVSKLEKIKGVHNIIRN